MSFVHLHTHSCYSFLDGASTIDRLLEKTKRSGMTALALTDHNCLTGAIRFYDKAKAQGIKPLIGAEIDVEGGHLTLLCKDAAGYSNLCRILTEAHLLAPDRIPRATKESLSRHRGGLIALSGCARGEIPLLIAAGDHEEAVETARYYRDVYGADYFIELIRYPSREGMNFSHRLADFALEQHLPVVATNNVHYADMKSYNIKELLNAIDQNIPVSRLRGYRTVEQYLKSPKEMMKLFKDIPEAIGNTLEIASRCNLDLDLGRPKFPKFTPPGGLSDDEYLSGLAYEGTLRKYGSLNGTVRTRLDYELDTIRQLGYCGYFLAVWDMVAWAKKRGIRCFARGSACDSLVVYALDISNVDPIEHDLLFERFMHPLRHEPPDIDIDIDRRRRDELRDYLYGKYGADNVCCVSTINTYQARGAIRDAGKALGLQPELIDDLCNGIHWLSMKGLLQNTDTLPELKSNALYKTPDIDKLLKLCAAIDGFPKHLSVHLGGLLIGEGRLSDMVPLERASGGDIISQYDKDDIERIGLVKIDLLALPTFTVIEDAIADIKSNHGVDIDIDAVPHDDPDVFAMLRDGKTIGTFQLESPAQREMAGRLLPDSFADIIVSISLVRPGPLKSNMDKDYLPRRHGMAPVTYLHPKLIDSLKETLGVILYQEQVLKVAHDLAGLSYAEADGFRRAMTHDRTDDEMNKMKDSFISSALKNGVKKAVAEEVFTQLAAFAAYGFCKAHAVAYALTAYQTLWLKRHYPAEFFAAVLSNQPMGYYPARVLIADARRFGVTVLPPDINYSSDRFTAENGAIRVAFRQMRGISEQEIAAILAERNSAKFASLKDVVMRAGIGQVALKNLCSVGAFDAFGNRGVMQAQISMLMALRQRMAKGPKFLYALALMKSTVAEAAPVVYSAQDTMLAERRLLSIDLTSHPLDFIELGIDVTMMKDLPAAVTGSEVTIVGSVIRYQTPPTRNGNRVIYIIMEDGTGIADVTVFRDVQEKCGDALFREAWLRVTGKVQRRGPKSLSIIAQCVRGLSAHR